MIAFRVKERRSQKVLTFRSPARWCFSGRISWWLVQQVIGDAALRLPDVDLLAPRMLGIDEHRYEPLMTTIVNLDTGQVLGVVDGRDHMGVGDWLFARPVQWWLGVQVVAIDPSAFRKALRMRLPAPRSRWTCPL
ncbi:transposase [Arthrobacter sp. OY3WO11]|uniref:transposase n=1 Tax=Arthrobacter sp. OY3WO11 TaxID=1835723 RepID=UPI0007CF9316|nr:transposase [Arthrobacter sp. OY3WO11]OAD97655.1 hypothetical protein A6A22_19780 [Arthrobacter sp. OY3WO11]